MKKKILSLIVSALLLTSCKTAEQKIGDEIKIPIYESEEIKYNTCKAEYVNLSENIAIPASIGYLYQDKIKSTVEGNLLAYNAATGSKIKEGDIIAAIDSSSRAYELSAQEIIVSSAYSNYLATGSEADLLKYQLENEILNQLKYELDCYNIRAPYDCIIVSTQRFATGDVIGYGQELAAIAKPDEAYIYCNKDTANLRLGMDISVKLSNSNYNGKIISYYADFPKTASRELNNIAIIEMLEGEMERLIEDTPNAVSAGWATIYATITEKNNVLAVNAQAVKTFNGKTYCYVIENNEKIQLAVETGITLNGQTIILSGLTEGDVVSL